MSSRCITTCDASALSPGVKPVGFAVLIAMASICHASEPREGVLARTVWPDHLWPVDYADDKQEKAYRAYIEKRLCPTTFDCGRFIEMPPFRKSEFSVSIYSVPTRIGDVTFRLTSIDAADNLRDWTDAGRLPDRATKIRIQRIDAEIPPATAVLLKDLWTKMLSGRQRPRKQKIESEVVYGDPTVGEFSIQLRSAKVLRGETDLIPDLGKNTAAFVKIAEQLLEYCKAQPAKRAAILASIERKAKDVLARVKANG